MTYTSRRGFAQIMGAAGGGLLLTSLARQVMAAGEGVLPKRFLTFITPAGHVADEFFPKGTPQSYTFGRILQPLEKWKSKILIADQLTIRKDVTQPGDDHQQGTGKLLTGANLLPGPFGGAEISPGWSSAPSLDQVLAEKMGTKSIYAGVQVTRHNTWSRYSYIGRDKPNTPVGNPAELYRMLFSNVAAMPGTQLSSAPKPVSGKASIDFLLADAKRLQARLPAPERTRLDEQLQFLNDRAKKLSDPQGTPTGTTAGCQPPTSDMNLNFADNANHERVGRLLMDNIVAAMRCDIARVAVLQWSQSISDTQFTWILPGQSIHHHSMTHQFNGTGGQASSYLAPMATELFVRASVWYAQQFAYLLAALDAVPEGNGTMLDNTIVFWGTETNGFPHGHTRMPFLLAGGGGGTVKGGWMVYKRFHNDLLTAIAGAMGFPMKTFGEASYCKEPVSLT